MKWTISLNSPDGDFTTKEVMEMVMDWFKAKHRKGITYRVLITVKKVRIG